SWRRTSRPSSMAMTWWSMAAWSAADYGRPTSRACRPCARRSVSAKAKLALAGLLAGCLQQQQPDFAYLPVALQPPYSDLPDAPAGTTIEPGMPIKLDPRQQEAVVSAVRKWMKEPGTASFGALNAVKAR